LSKARNRQASRRFKNDVVPLLSL